LWNNGERENAVPARVIAQQRRFWRIAGDFGECWAEVTGKLRLCVDKSVEWPAAGDWVEVEFRDAKSTARIQEVLPRRSRFVRETPGKKISKQALAQ
jgi:ribosome biogenesis GTPase / thiamine phosphate phosphatase